MLLTSQIENIIANKGKVRHSSNIGFGREPAGWGDAGQTFVDGHYDFYFQNTELKVADGVILLNRVADRANGATFNCVNVVTETDKACMGPVRFPGYVYTDNFSGCVFYLYREDAIHVIGVHAHQGLEQVRTKVKCGPFKLRTKYINSQVRKEYGPQGFMDPRSKQMIARHETRGEMTTEETGGTNKHFLAFLSCVDVKKATTFLYVYKPISTYEHQIVRLVHKYVDPF